MGNLRSSQDFPRIFKLTEKVTLVNDDLFIIEDSADSNKRKKVKSVNVGGAGGSSPTTTLGDLIVRGASIDERFALGAEGEFLRVLGTNPLKVDWDDFYEEQSFDPELKFGGNNVGLTYSFRSGSLVRVGEQVSVNIFILISNSGSSVGKATIDGFSYNANSTGGACPMFLSNVNFTAGTYLECEIVGGDLKINELDSSTGIASQFTEANFKNFSLIKISAVYVRA